MYDFSYQQDGLRAWNEFQIGPGKLVPWDEIYIKHQLATDLTTEQENFCLTPRVTHGSAHDMGASVGMPRTTFKSVEEMEQHISVGQHTETVYEKLKRGWVEKFSSLTLNFRRRQYQCYRETG